MFTSTSYDKIYGLIGYPLGHSFSQDFFNKKFDAEHISARYINFEIPNIEQIVDIVDQYPNLKGFNVTIPYKEKIIDYLDAIDKEAESIGAVNVVKIFRQPDGSLTFKGYNSDAIGFGDSIKPLLNLEIHRKALILGTGGASKAVVHALRSMDVECTLVSRSARPGNHIRRPHP